MPNQISNSQNNHLRSYTMLFAQKLCETIGDMTSTRFSVLEESFKEQSYRFNNGMTVYIHFYGEVQGEFIIGIDERTALQLTGLGDPDTDNLLQYRDDLSGFFNEVLNIASAKTLPEIEIDFDNLTYFPAIVAFGDIIFPEVRSSLIEIKSDTAVIQCGFSLNMVSAKIIKRLEKIEKSLESTTKLASTDALTKMYNRTFFEGVFNAYIDDSRKNNQSLSILLIDIDLFKKVNDTYGHPVGDQVLRIIAQTIRDLLRNTDIAVRYGGDEMLVVLPNTCINNAVHVAKRIQDIISKEITVQGADGKNINVSVTISIGCTGLNDSDDAVSFFERADANLYRAKESGRNKVANDTTET